VTTGPFQLLHCDVWTSPVSSVSGFQYYLAILDDYTHFVWVYPLRQKSEVASIIISLCAFVQTQFQRAVCCFQSDNGKEFDNQVLRNFFTSRGILFRLSCPYTSPQNGKAERILRTLNDCTRTLLLQASMPYRFWAEALATAAYLLNRRPCKATIAISPFQKLYGVQPDYQHLRTFGCLCYPNITAIAPHKLAPRSIKCVLLGYSPDHKGYRCLDLSSGCVLTSRHVYFEEDCFPFAQEQPSRTPASNDADGRGLPRSDRQAATSSTRSVCIHFASKLLAFANDICLVAPCLITHPSNLLTCITRPVSAPNAHSRTCRRVQTEPTICQHRYN